MRKTKLKISSFYADERTFEDDGKILKVYEAFCLNTKSRHLSSGDKFCYTSI